MSLLLSLLASSAEAAEVQFDGFYRARMRAFDSLVLDRASPLNTGATAYAQHRLWLQPKFLLTDEVAVFAQIRGFDDLVWGVEQADREFDPNVPNVFEYDLLPPTATTDPAFTLLDLSLWRAWAEVYTSVGQFTFGRVPLMWGNGVWLNDGVTVDPLFADFGDTTDRVMWEHLINDQVYLRASVDTVAERLLDGTNDDTTAYALAAAYRTEDVTAGITGQLDHTGSADGAALNLVTVDAAASVTLGRLTVSAEAVGQFGGGSLTQFGGLASAVNIFAMGGVLDASLGLDPYRLRLRGGFASGDGNPGDNRLRTFTFDRDYSVGLFLFEQPLLTVGVDPLDPTVPVAMKNAISNALFVKPSIERRIVDGLWVEASWLGARVARAPVVNGIRQSRGYGNEFHLAARYEGIEHVLFDARFAGFVPGGEYTRTPDATAPTDFDSPVFGFQLTGMVAF